ncbi:ABC transporter permease [Atopobacter sp. AH10]|uniref:ABC transporter permease n=1 Tax=Atopobacter sp. AH10 TaxID=2315861 RepID=UPI000EF25837|nr:ABC transporter permease [Atopobacter sp. AH10]RLK63802.1 ABC transporter permease [Atopobacter sp. AH10]
MQAIEFRERSNLGVYGLGLLIKYELIAFLENKGAVLSLFVTPILYFVFICLGVNRMAGNISYEGISISYLEYSLTGITMIFIISQMSQTIYRTTIDKRYGLLALKLLSGIKPIYYVLGMSTYAVLGLFIQVFALIAIATLFGIRFSLLQMGLLAITISLILIFWSSLAVALTLRINNYEVRDNIISFVITPLSFTAPVFYVLDYVPEWMQILAKINPVTYQLEALRQGLFLGNYGLPILVLASLAIVAILFSSRLVAKSTLSLSEY